MSGFGREDPREMPAHLFSGSLRVDYESAVRADPERQNCSICPRHWYVDATFRCDRCGREFEFKAAEQRVWYEEYGFWIDSLPKRCLVCRRDLRDMKATRQEYDRLVAEALRTGDVQLKKRLAAVIDRLYELGGPLPARINENRRCLALQIEEADSRREPC
jgi:Probable zinc-ribbon domain